MALAGMTQEQTNNENRKHCKRIAEEIELYASGSAYKCPECGEVHEWDALAETEHENEEKETCYRCPNCNSELYDDEFEQMSLYDYFGDCYDIEYRCSSDREYRSVRVMVACGGPNIYIDTATKSVELYWWTDRASYPLLSDAVDAVDEWAEEYWGLV